MAKKMAHAKHQKPRQNKQPHSQVIADQSFDLGPDHILHRAIKKRGKQANISEFRANLAALGLQIVQVTADGNCFFRALADQLEGNEEEHEKYRSMVVQYIMKNREMFEPFIEDGIPFEEYCQTMENNGTWAGHMELQAASLLTHSNICIHRLMSPRWYIRNFSDNGSRMIHLSYHDEEHYNSVRSQDDPCNGPARSIVIKADANVTAASLQAKVSAKNSKRDTLNANPAASIKLVMAGSGCENAENVAEVLLQLEGDVDAAIEYLVAEQAMQECKVDDDKDPCELGTPCGMENDMLEQVREECENNAHKEDSCSNPLKRNESPRPNDKKISRNQICPCGSKRKYKACCGSFTGKSLAKFTANQRIDSCKGKKDKRRGKNATPAKVPFSFGSNGAVPDMGALCI